MPNHLHLILLLKEQRLISDFVRDFKKFTETKIRIKLEEDNRYDLLNLLKSNIKNQACKIWMNRFDVKAILAAKCF
jgi:REP element-mobilizing transposase RayT